MIDQNASKKDYVYMARYLLVFLQGAGLALGVLLVSVLAVSPFTEYGILTAPGRVNAGGVILRMLPVHGSVFVNMLPELAWVPLTTALISLPQGIGLLRHLRWIGFVINLAALGYLYHTFPGLGAPQNMPMPLVATAVLFLASTILLAIMPSRPAASTRSASFAVFLTVLLWLASAGLLIYGASLHNLTFTALGGVAGCVAAMTLAFYCLVKAIRSPSSKSGTGLGAVGYLLVPLLIGLALFFGGAMPLTLPIGAGVLLFFAVGMS